MKRRLWCRVCRQWVTARATRAVTHWPKRSRWIVPPRLRTLAPRTAQTYQMFA